MNDRKAPSGKWEKGVRDLFSFKWLALLDQAQIDEAVKVRILGLQLMNVVGPSVLTAAVASLRDEMKKG